MKQVMAAMVVMLAGCAQQAPVTADTPPAAPGTQCDVNPAQVLVGRTASEAAAEAKRLSGAATVRQYESGAALTMDFRADRLNIETDAGGKIVKLGCG